MPVCPFYGIKMSVQFTPNRIKVHKAPVWHCVKHAHTERISLLHVYWDMIIASKDLEALRQNDEAGRHIVHRSVTCPWVVLVWESSRNRMFTLSFSLRGIPEFRYPQKLLPPLYLYQWLDFYWTKYYIINKQFCQEYVQLTSKGNYLGI